MNQSVWFSWGGGLGILPGKSFTPANYPSKTRRRQKLIVPVLLVSRIRFGMSISTFDGSVTWK